MALIGSLSTGVSAMKSFVKGMETIGHNIANVNTIGYKAQRTNYADNFSETLRGALPQTGERSNTPPMQVGSGVALGSVQKLFSQGSISQTGVNSDLAIGGNGFFRVYDPTNNTSYLTRNGNLRVNQEGYMVDQNGHYLLGLTGGDANNSPSVIDRIRIDLASEVRVDSTDRPIDGLNRIVLEDGNRATANAGSSTGYYYADSEGRPLNAAGQIVLANGDVVEADASSPTGYTNMTTSTSWDPNEPVPAIAPITAAAEWDPTLEAVATPSAADPHQVPLAIQSWAIDQEGRVNLFLNDGSTYSRGQILLQQVNDPEALTMMGNGLYAGIINAGPIGDTSWSIGTIPTAAQLQANRPNENGVGFIQSRSLEGSNVDLTEEFSNMITTQRSFQAGSRMISASDDMLQEIVNLKR